MVERKSRIYKPSLYIRNNELIIDSPADYDIIKP